MTTTPSPKSGRPRAAGIAAARIRFDKFGRVIVSAELAGAANLATFDLPPWVVSSDTAGPTGGGGGGTDLSCPVVACGDPVVGCDAEVIGCVDVLVGCDAEVIGCVDVLVGCDAEVIGCVDVLIGCEAEVIGCADVLIGCEAEVIACVDSLCIDIFCGDDEGCGSDEACGSDNTCDIGCGSTPPPETETPGL